MDFPTDCEDFWGSLQGKLKEGNARQEIRRYNCGGRRPGRRERCAGEQMIVCAFQDYP